MMKMTTTKDSLSTVSAPAKASRKDSVVRIYNATNGLGLMKFCRELALLMIRRHAGEEDACQIRQTLAAELQSEISCTALQAGSLIDLALEIIHVRVHGTYRRSPLELSYLIAMANGAVGDLSAN